MPDAPATSPPPVDEKLLCPLCEYDLRGLIEPRCPECGYRFDWAELRDPTLRLHPYLFEHHPNHNIRSFFRTLIGGFRPRRFWSTLYPTQPSRPRRLVLYFVIVCLIGIVPAIANIAATAAQVWSNAVQTRAQYLNQIQGPSSASWRQYYGNLTPQQILDKILPLPTRRQLLSASWQQSGTRTIVRFQLPLLIWPLLTFAAMMIFRLSMRAARVRTVHVLRCVVYSADLLVWLNLMLGAALIASAVTSLTGAARTFQAMDETYVVIVLLAWCLFAYRFATALRLYLRFDHPRLTMAATQVLTILTVLVLISEAYNHYRW